MWAAHRQSAAVEWQHAGRWPAEPMDDNVGTRSSPQSGSRLVTGTVLYQTGHRMSNHIVGLSA